ncbi:MAG: haloacid dehalogenase type II [Candidatus Methylomirabilales bacterium]
MLQWNDFEVLTFDCYGTLIDWETGILESLRPIFAAHRIDLIPDSVLESYGELESAAELGEYREYKAVLRSVLEGLGARLGFVPTAAEMQQFSMSVKEWPAFPDSPSALQALHRKYRLAILSNIDDDLFAFSAERLQVKFDWIITAQQAKSYKPSLNNFRLAFERIGVPQKRILHVAQSLFHDIAPANVLGLSTVWVNRRRNKAGLGATPVAQARPDLEVPDLRTLAGKIALV